jgi:DNA repair protein RadC
MIPFEVIRDGRPPVARCPRCGNEMPIGVAGLDWTVRTPSDVADRLMLQLGSLAREELHSLVMNAKNRVLAQERVYQGNVSNALVRVGEVVEPVLRAHGAGLILVHNHPSGDPSPSPDDLHLTAQVLAACRLLDISFLDHIVVAAGSYVSLRDRGISFDRPR